VGEQTLIREEMNALVAEVRRDMAFADLEAAHGAMLVSLGVESGDDPKLIAMRSKNLIPPAVSAPRRLN